MTEQLIPQALQTREIVALVAIVGSLGAVAVYCLYQAGKDWISDFRQYHVERRMQIALRHNIRDRELQLLAELAAGVKRYRPAPAAGKEVH